MLTDGQNDDENSCECPCQCLQDPGQDNFCSSLKNPTNILKHANPGRNPVNPLKQVDPVEPVCPPEVQRIDSISPGTNHYTVSLVTF